MIKIVVYFSFVCLFLACFPAHGQQIIGKLSEADAKNISVIKEQMNFLLLSKTPEKPTLHQTEFPVSWAVYDSLISSGYDLDHREKFRKEFDSSFGMMSFQKVLIYNADLVLDVLPLDSIGIKIVEEEGIITDHRLADLMFYSLGYIVGDRFANCLTIVFTPENRILAIFPFVDFDKENEGIDIEGFQARNNFHLIKNRIIHLGKGESGSPEKIDLD